MDWENERYVRVYVRDSADDMILTWEARALWHELLRKFDRSGVLDMGKHGLRALAALVRMPVDVVTDAAAQLEADGRIEINAETGRVVAPNFIEAQEAKQSDKLRQAESRARRREVSRNVTECHDSSQPVTTGHTVSQPVTPSLAVLSRAEPSLISIAQPPVEREVSRVDLESVYAMYPRKQGKEKGMDAAAKIIRTRDDFELYRRCVEFMARAFKTKDDRKFCPHFSTFINAKNWRDEEWPGSDRISHQASFGGIGDFQEGADA